MALPEQYSYMHGQKPLVLMAMSFVKGVHASHGVAQVAILSQVESQGTGVANVYNADQAISYTLHFMYHIHFSIYMANSCYAGTLRRRCSHRQATTPEKH
jgi:hypothetical protein